MESKGCGSAEAYSASFMSRNNRWRSVRISGRSRLAPCHKRPISREQQPVTRDPKAFWAIRLYHANRCDSSCSSKAPLRFLCLHVTTYRGSSPWQFAIAVRHSSSSWQFAVAVRRDSSPREAATSAPSLNNLTICAMESIIST